MKKSMNPFHREIPFAHGGEIRKGKRKLTRPLSPRKALHVVMRSTRAKGRWSLLHPSHQTRIRTIITTTANRKRVRITNQANVGNHIHLLVRFRHRKDLQDFLRIVAGRIAMVVTQARKGHPVGKFWDKLAFTRIVQWGKDYKRTVAYLYKNLGESLGILNKRIRAQVIAFHPDGSRTMIRYNPG